MNGEGPSSQIIKEAHRDTNVSVVTDKGDVMMGQSENEKRVSLHLGFQGRPLNKAA